ncbi:GMC family oxidoreductase N-terminal domain-containing protein [Actinomadura parmotrematis]|uniref:GMC family oxidoreductase N-terminal domain-containing protein n=1 Tax=Actinomadura parmotrematis TaxID=2864039 RepID=A0ABS7FRY8_9ACTN|nr:GMC family oxidoreductase N-terminal domain-containing protein [Actinomadura parmotrematis]MBW8483168.1 GMC family oxidoreductase N-terminal domain-containing protein [Actinomadura parmotrematis]
MSRDVIVIGAGGGGPVVAKELAARGLDVLLLEAGARYADPRREWTHLENDANNPLTGFLRFGPADRTEPAWLREEPQNSYLLQAAGVGGTTLHYYGNSPRAYAGVFHGYDGADRSRYDAAHAFPFGYRELIPYYEWAEATLPVQTAAMGVKETVFLSGAEHLGIPVQTRKDTTGWSYRPQENAILQPGGTAGRTGDPARLHYPEATGCTFCGYCFQGCMEPAAAPRNQFAKRSTDNSYVPMAITAPAWAPHGRAVTLLADSYAVKVHTERREGRTVAAGVTWVTGATGERHREDARVVVLAGGATETPRLWLNSGLPDPNGWVGRGYTDHFLDGVTGLFDGDTGNSRGPSSAARCDFPGHGALENIGLTPAMQAFVMNMSDSGLRGRYRNGRGLTGNWDGRTGRVAGAELKEVLTHGVDRLLNVLILTDDDVEAHNRVTRSVLPPDAHGPVPKVVFRSRERTRRTLANREFLARKAADLLRGAGAKRVYRFDWAPLLLHVHSTMRMGLSADDSVLNGDARSRWVDALYVADNSALANSLGGPNPTLTTQALATRTAEKIFTGHFGGHAWVGHEDPVPSTDPRVSRAL